MRIPSSATMNYVTNEGFYWQLQDAARRLGTRLTFQLQIRSRSSIWRLLRRFAEVDHRDLQNPDYAEQWRLTLAFRTRTPFYFLDPAFAHTSGFQWWHRRLRKLIAIVGIDAVAKKVMCLEHFPYSPSATSP